MKIQVESCRDCLNLEDRRFIDNVAFCAMRHGPSVTCPEFISKNGRSTVDNESDLFCINCAHYEDIKGVAICNRDHQPGIACGAFRRKVTS
jgi:hypothetical protein